MFSLPPCARSLGAGRKRHNAFEKLCRVGSNRNKNIESEHGPGPLNTRAGRVAETRNMERLLVDPRYAPAFAARGWGSFASVFAHFLPDYARLRKMTVQRVTVPMPTGGVDAFFKLYHLRASAWLFWMRAPKARREFQNYQTFARLGVPAAEAIACGEERGAWGQLLRAFIITRTVPEACELDDFFQSGPPRAQRDQICRELAKAVRRLHTAHFYYHDLVWRNILVSRVGGGSKVFLLDCPRGGMAWFGRGRKRLRDLASLDKSAVRLCSRPDRLRFLLRYLGKSRPDAESRALARACLHYRRTRWPEDWRGK